jgi:hypothetical protein
MIDGSGTKVVGVLLSASEYGQYLAEISGKGAKTEAAGSGSGLT